MKIDFYWNSSIVGRTHHMKIDGKEINLGLHRFSNSEKEAKTKILEILKQDYNLDYNDEDINFECRL